MRTLLTLTAAAICLSFTPHPDVKNTTPAPSAPTEKAAVSRPASFPTDVNWTIGYFSGLPLVTLTWPSFSQPGLGPVQFTFQGVMQYINPTTTTSIYWSGITLTPNVSYTMNIGGVNYYFYWPGGNAGQCIITGHS
jgi:hypothetical protein